MPGRASAQRSTVSHLPLKSSAQNINSRKSIASRAPPSTITTPDEGPLTTLRTRVCGIFNDAQRTNAGHRKLVIGLRKIQESCCDDSTGNQEFSEEDFNVEITRCMIRTVCVRKSEGVGDRTVKFLGHFLRHATEKGRDNGCDQMLKFDAHSKQMWLKFQKVMLTTLNPSRKLQARD